MKFRIRFADQIVGIFVLVAAAALIFILILMGTNQRWFAKDYYFHSRFVSASGLKEGMAIKLKGFEIGRVDSFELNEDNNVDVVIEIYDTYYSKVKPNSVLELSAGTFGFGGGLSFHPGRNDAEPIAENSFIPSLDFDEGKKLVADDLVDMPKSGDAISSIIARVGPMLEQIDNTLVEVQTLIRSANSAITGKNVGPLGDILVNVKGLTDQLSTTIDTVNRTVNNVDTMIIGIDDQIDPILDNVGAMTEQFRDPTGLVTTLLDPKGSIATILDDDDVLFAQIESILERINGTIDEVQQFTGYLNSATPQISGLIENTREALDKGKDVMEGLKNNPLLRGGITETREQTSSFQSYRDEDF